MSALTLASRVLGYVRDSLNAALFGAGTVADAYFVAFRIPNILRDLVGEGALSAALIPTLAKTARKGGIGEAGRLTSAMLTIVALGGAVLVAAGYFAAPWIVHFLAPGFLGFPAKFELTVSLTRWLFPFIVFISLAAVTMGLLNSQERFAAPAMAPLALNASIILGGVFCLVVGGKIETVIYYWTFAVLLGGAAQWLVQTPAAGALGFRYSFRLWHPAVVDVALLMAPALVGFSVSQIHILVNTILASLLPEGSIAYLYYGNRLMQLPLGVFGVALSTAAYPVVARAFARGRPREAAAPIDHGLCLAFLTVLPASAGLIALAPEINGLLFRYGRFGPADVAVTASVSVAYAIGIIGHSVGRIFTPAFYAAGKPYLPVVVAGFGVTANVLLSMVLMFPLGIVGLPLSTSVVALATALWLGALLRRSIPGLFGAGVVSSLWRSLLASALMGAVVWKSAARGREWLVSAGITGKPAEVLLVLGGIVLGAGVFFLAARLFGVKELGEVSRALRGRGGK